MRTMYRTFALLGAASLLLAVLPYAAAEQPVALTGCSVSVGSAGSQSTCTFECTKGEKVTTSAAAGDGTVTTSGSCGGASSSVSSKKGDGGKSSESANPATSGGEGVCSISVTDNNDIHDQGTGSCGTVCPDDGECQPKCPDGVYVGEVCIPLSQGAACEIARALIDGGQDERTQNKEIDPCVSFETQSTLELPRVSPTWLP